MKKIIISESQMHGLNEYLDKKVLAPLKRYLDKYNYDGQMETAPDIGTGNIPRSSWKIWRRGCRPDISTICKM